MLKSRLFVIGLLVAAVFACGCFEQQQSVHVQDKYTTNTFGGSQRYYVVDGSMTYECIDSGIYDALEKGGTYSVVVNTDNKITKVVT